MSEVRLPAGQGTGRWQRRERREMPQAPTFHLWTAQVEEALSGPHTLGAQKTCARSQQRALCPQDSCPPSVLPTGAGDGGKMMSPAETRAAVGPRRLTAPAVSCPSSLCTTPHPATSPVIVDEQSQAPIIPRGFPQEGVHRNNELQARESKGSVGEQENSATALLGGRPCPQGFLLTCPHPSMVDSDGEGPALSTWDSQYLAAC